MDLINIFYVCLQFSSLVSVLFTIFFFILYGVVFIICFHQMCLWRIICYSLFRFTFVFFQYSVAKYWGMFSIMDSEDLRETWLESRNVASKMPILNDNPFCRNRPFETKWQMHSMTGRTPLELSEGLVQDQCLFLYDEF